MSNISELLKTINNLDYYYCTRKYLDRPDDKVTCHGPFPNRDDAISYGRDILPIGRKRQQIQFIESQPKCFPKAVQEYFIREDLKPQVIMEKTIPEYNFFNIGIESYYYCVENRFEKFRNEFILLATMENYAIPKSTVTCYGPLIRERESDRSESEVNWRLPARSVFVHRLSLFQKIFGLKFNYPAPPSIEEVIEEHTPTVEIQNPLKFRAGSDYNKSN